MKVSQLAKLALGRSPRSAGAPLTLLLALSSGCVSEESYTLTVRIEDAAARVESAALGAQVSGEFRVTAKLGEHSPDAAHLVFSLASLTREGKEVYGPLNVDNGFEIELQPDESSSAEATYSDKELVDADVVAELCRAPVELALVFEDEGPSGEGTRTVQSSPFDVSCD